MCHCFLILQIPSCHLYSLIFWKWFTEISSSANRVWKKFRNSEGLSHLTPVGHIPPNRKSLTQQGGMRISKATRHRLEIGHQRVQWPSNKVNSMSKQGVAHQKAWCSTLYGQFEQGRCAECIALLIWDYKGRALLTLTLWPSRAWQTDRCRYADRRLTTSLGWHALRQSFRGVRATLIFSCGELWNLEASPWLEEGRGGKGCNGCRCVLLSQLLEQMARLQEEITRLWGTWESERKADRRRSAHADRQSLSNSLPGEEAKPTSHLNDKEHDRPNIKGDISAWRRMRCLLFTPTVPLSNR